MTSNNPLANCDSAYQSSNWVVRDGKVAIIISPGFGAGWYTWNHKHPQILSDPKIVRMIEENRHYEIEEYAEKTYGEDGYYSAGQLTIQWVPAGVRFRVHEYDGAESIVLENEDNWFVSGLYFPIPNERRVK